MGWLWRRRFVRRWVRSWARQRCHQCRRRGRSSYPRNGGVTSFVGLAAKVVGDAGSVGGRVVSQQHLFGAAATLWDQLGIVTPSAENLQSAPASLFGISG